MSKIALLILLVIIFSCNEGEINTNNTDSTDETRNYIDGLELPALEEGDVLVERFAYSFVYKEDWDLAKWVAYELTSDELADNYDRTDNFRPDPLVSTGTANSDDYSGSGFDRGHLQPAADVTWNEQAMSESFFYSNIAPQTPKFNRGIWSELEERYRELALKHDTIWVVTGCLVGREDGNIGANYVKVPSNFFKAAIYFDKTVNEYKATAHLLDALLEDYDTDDLNGMWLKDINWLEETIGIDLFPRLPDEIEDRVESIGV